MDWLIQHRPYRFENPKQLHSIQCTKHRVLQICHPIHLNKCQIHQRNLFWSYLKQFRKLSFTDRNCFSDSVNGIMYPVSNTSSRMSPTSGSIRQSYDGSDSFKTTDFGITAGNTLDQAVSKRLRVNYFSFCSWVKILLNSKLFVIFAEAVIEISFSWWKSYVIQFQVSENIKA